MSNIKNAQITGTFLGNEDHEILTWSLTLNLGLYSQGFGGYSMENTAKLSEHVKALLGVAGARTWEELKGKYVRVEYESDSYNARIKRIGHMINDTWFNPKS